MVKKIAELVDMSALQAYRLHNKQFIEAIDQLRFHPFPDNEYTANPTSSDSGITFKTNFFSTFHIHYEGVSSFGSSLPGYFFDNIYQKLHEDDESFTSFLNIFDRRLYTLSLQIERDSLLISSKDRHPMPKNNVVDIIQSKNVNINQAICLTQFIFPFLSKVRSLSTLKNILTKIVSAKVDIQVNLHSPHLMDEACLTSLSSSKLSSNRLGQGAVLGQLCLIPAGRLKIIIHCNKADDLHYFETNPTLFNNLRSIINLYLSEAASFDFYARIQRSHLKARQLLSNKNKNQNNRFFFFNMLSPQFKPSEMVLVKLLTRKPTSVQKTDIFDRPKKPIDEFHK